MSPSKHILYLAAGCALMVVVLLGLHTAYGAEVPVHINCRNYDLDAHELKPAERFGRVTGTKLLSFLGAAYLSPASVYALSVGRRTFLLMQLGNMACTKVVTTRDFLGAKIRAVGVDI